MFNEIFKAVFINGDGIYLLTIICVAISSMVFSTLLRVFRKGNAGVCVDIGGDAIIFKSFLACLAVAVAAFFNFFGS